MPRELTAPVAGTVSAIAQPGERSRPAVCRRDRVDEDGVRRHRRVGRRSDARGRRGGRHVAAGQTSRRSARATRRCAAGGAPTGAALDAVLARHAAGLDAARPEAVARRREQGRRTARENVADLVDEGTFVEYGPLIFAAQERRRPKEELIARTPADGLVGGLGEIDGPPARRHVLRLHGPGRHAGHAQPPQEGPAVRARRAAAAAGRAVRRGWGRAAGRRRLADRRRARLPRVPPLRRGCRARAAGRASPRATASPATRRCSAAATS